MAKSGKMRHKQIMAMNDTSFNKYFRPKFSFKQLNFKNGVNVLRFPLYKTLLCHIYWLQKEETIFPTRLIVKK